MGAIEDEWLVGWDPTPGIVSVWAGADGRACVWRRVAGELVREDVRFRPWMVIDSVEGLAAERVDVRELAGDGALRFLVRAHDQRTLVSAVLDAASRRLGHRVPHVRELGERAIQLPLEEQYLVASGRTYFRGLAFADLRRVQLDLETTGLDPVRDRIFLVAVRAPGGTVSILDDADEPALIRRLAATICELDPDVIENHNLHGFDLPFLERRARLLGVPLALGRAAPGVPAGFSQRAARRGMESDDDGRSGPRLRFTLAGRELIDTLDAVMRHDFATRELSGHGLEAVARELGIARPDREHVPGDRIHEVYASDPDRVRRYASHDVEEVAALAQRLGGPAFALARMAPRRYERLADAGPATGVIDPLLVRAYLRSATALPARVPTLDGTQHTGAALHLFASGVAHRIVKADVASLYPSLMRQYRIGPARDRLGALLAIVDRLVEQRLAAKAAAKLASPGSAERHAHEAMSAAMKLVINSAYGYLAAGGLTRFADVHAANEVTRRGRALLSQMCGELEARGVTLLEADTDGVYFAVPAEWTAADERRVVDEVAALLPPLVKLELEGRYAAMLSHEPKNYALLGYDGELVLRGVAFRSSRAEPYGERFLRRALERLFAGDIAGVQRVYIETVAALRRRELPTAEVCARVRLAKSPEEYLASRDQRRELPYEALLASGRATWLPGERVRVYRRTGGGAGLVPRDEDAPLGPADYDVEHYVRLLRDTYAQRLARALAPEIFAAVFAEPDQLSLFAPSLVDARPILTAADRDPL